MVDDIKSIMQDIDKLIKQELFDEAYEKYRLVDYNLNKIRYIEFGMRENEKQVLAEFYSSYAYFLLSFDEYDQFFKMYIKAQKCGYSSEKRRKFLYETFIEPNIEAFIKNYETNIKNMKAEFCIERTMSLDELPYWLITTGKEHEYYLYEKETDLIGRKISLDIEEAIDIEVTEKSSDYLIVEDRCWSKTWGYIKKITSANKKVYLIIEDIGKFISYLQAYIIEDKHLDKLIILEDMNSFKYYFMDSNNYFPRDFIGRDEEKCIYESLIKDIHNYRLTKDGRSGKDVLLSICIPSFNRGIKAYDNIIHTIKSELDEEIEIILCNNGTEKESEVYYDKISKIADPRLSYFKFKENKYFHMSLLKILELAKGKYALLLSDEDRLDLEQLRLVVNTLNCREEEISLIRTRTDGQGIVPYIGMTSPGEESLFKFMLTSNYMSGSIYNKEILKKYKAIEWFSKKVEKEDFEKIGACFCYPHMVLELFMCQYGHVLGLDMILVNEGEPIEVDDDLIVKTDKILIPINATLEARLNQHEGFYDVIKGLEISRKDFYILRKMYLQLCSKTIFLVNLTINLFYKERNNTTSKLLEDTYNFEIKYLKRLYEGKKKINEKEYLEDFNEIKSYYNYYSNIQ